MRDYDAGVRVREGGAWGELVFFVCIFTMSETRATASKTRVFCDPAGQSIGRSAYGGVLAPERSRRLESHNSPLLSSRDHRIIGFSATPQCQTKNMQRLLFAMMASAASAFVPLQTTQYSLVRLHANPIDIYSAATARKYVFADS